MSPVVAKASRLAELRNKIADDFEKKLLKCNN
jgi:hypothetical protein